MDPIERQAMMIIIGKMNGDDFIWGAIINRPDGTVQYGEWKSVLEKNTKDDPSKKFTNFEQ